MTDEDDEDEINVTVALESKPEFTYTFEVNGKEGMTREQAIESAKHEASIALTEGAAFYEWEVIEVGSGKEEGAPTDEAERSDEKTRFSVSLSGESEQSMDVAGDMIRIGDVIDTGDERRTIVGVQGDTLIYYAPLTEEFGYMIEEVLEYELREDGEFVHLDGGESGSLPDAPRP